MKASRLIKLLAQSIEEIGDADINIRIISNQQSYIEHEIDDIVTVTNKDIVRNGNYFHYIEVNE